MRPRAAAGVQPRGRGVVGPLHQACRVAEVDRGDCQWAQRWDHRQVDEVVVERNVGDQALFDERTDRLERYAKGTRWRLAQRTRVTGGQDEHPVGAELHGLGDRGVVRQTTVDQGQPCAADRWQHAGYGGAGQDRAERITGGPGRLVLQSHLR